MGSGRAITGSGSSATAGEGVVICSAAIADGKTMMVSGAMVGAKVGMGTVVIPDGKVVR